MEALIIGLTLEGLAQTDGDLGAVGKGGQNVLAAAAVLLGQSQNGGEHHHGGMLGAVTMVVIHIESVAEGAVDQSGRLRRCLVVAANGSGNRITIPQLTDSLQAGEAGVHMAGGNDIAQQVHNEHLGVVDNTLRQVFKLQAGTDLCDLLRKGQFLFHSFFPLLNQIWK